MHGQERIQRPCQGKFRQATWAKKYKQCTNEIATNDSHSIKKCWQRLQSPKLATKNWSSWTSLGYCDFLWAQLVYHVPYTNRQWPWAVLGTRLSVTYARHRSYLRSFELVLSFLYRSVIFCVNLCHLLMWYSLVMGRKHKKKNENDKEYKGRSRTEMKGSRKISEKQLEEETKAPSSNHRPRDQKSNASTTRPL